MPKRESETEGRIPLSLSVTRDQKVLFEEEAAKAHQTVSAFACTALSLLIGAPRYGGVPMLPTSGFMVLPVGVEEFIFVPRNWGPKELRWAADFYEGLQKTMDEPKEEAKEKKRGK